uniref:Retrovirus-related Gag polyprotein from transposon gypsy n=2 Tax=Zeugodacus cucurbitae TaxID=28588 RepID=A0A0A1WJ71_ZEUCU
MTEQANLIALTHVVADLQRQLSELQLGRSATIPQRTEQICSYTRPEEVDLNMFKSLTQFNGDYNEYRNWRKVATTLMEDIRQFEGHNIYAQALIMIRGKITGKAAQILINHNVKRNFQDIIDRLDDSYADKRPIYVLEEDMMKIQQKELPLHVYYDNLNQALNVVLSKIEMTHKEERITQVLTQEIQAKAIRTFVTGLRSVAIKNAIYARACTTLADAYSIARTMQHDSHHQNLEYIPRYNHHQNHNFSNHHQNNYSCQQQPP